MRKFANDDTKTDRSPKTRPGVRPRAQPTGPGPTPEMVLRSKGWLVGRLVGLLAVLVTGLVLGAVLLAEAHARGVAQRADAHARGVAQRVPTCKAVAHASSACSMRARSPRAIGGFRCFGYRSSN